MLGYVISQGRGAADLLLAEVAQRLHAEGWPLAGALQVNVETDPARVCDMDLHVLAQDRVIRISQSLGPLSKGCRLDSSGLEQAVGMVEQALDGAPRPRLMIVNKFGKQEIDGRGFRPLIGRALSEGVPVLTAVSVGNREGFEAFAEGLGELLPLELEALLAWCRTAAG